MGFNFLRKPFNEKESVKNENVFSWSKIPSCAKFTHFISVEGIMHIKILLIVIFHIIGYSLTWFHTGLVHPEPQVVTAWPWLDQHRMDPGTGDHQPCYKTHNADKNNSKTKLLLQLNKWQNFAHHFSNGQLVGWDLQVNVTICWLYIRFIGWNKTNPESWAQSECK